MPAPSSPTQPITHIVLFKYKPTTTWPDLEAHLAAFRALPHRCLHPATKRAAVHGLAAHGQEPVVGAVSGGARRTPSCSRSRRRPTSTTYYLAQDPVHRAFSRAAAPLIVDDCVVVAIRDGVLFGPGAARPEGVAFLGEEGRMWKGSCHCGGMVWEVVVKGGGGEMKHVLCHCDTCKKLGGGPYSCNYIVPREDLTVTKGRPDVYTYKGASGKDVRCYFCPTCTSHIYHHQDAMPEKVIVRTLLLEGGNDLEAGGEIFPEGKLKWVQDLKESLDPIPTKKATNEESGVNGV
ncbi:hypothetical protein SLS58_011220 [Diplodia intermedia]|uniref:CENP-V/GFA domain-containing protein n=1 Tax=Diplodia intermedia TaxID=856260 RepID=A0ABR3T0M0_9PEZI